MKAEPALRLTVFVQGCSHRCPGCQNPQTHGPTGGKAVPVEALLAELDGNPLVDGLSLSGGEPMEQPEGCVLLARAARRRGLNVWCWTRFLFEDLLTGTGGAAGVFAGSGCAGGRAVSSLTADAGSPLARDRNQWVIDVKRALI